MCSAHCCFYGGSGSVVCPLPSLAPRAAGTYNNGKVMVMDPGNGRRRDGQAMLIAVLSLGGAILGATAIAGILTLYQLRASNDTENSAKALFAADAGVEWTLFDYYCTVDGRCPSGPPDDGQATPPAGALPSFTNGAALTVSCSDINGSSSVCSDATTTVGGITLGTSAGTRRAFAVSLVGATSTDP